MAKKMSLAEKIRNVEESSSDLKPRTATVNQITSSDGSKDKQISAKVNTTTYDLFTKINDAQGLSNNSAINMLINKYVRENKDILD